MAVMVRKPWTCALKIIENKLALLYDLQRYSVSQSIGFEQAVYHNSLIVHNSL